MATFETWHYPSELNTTPSVTLTQEGYDCELRKYAFENAARLHTAHGVKGDVLETAKKIETYILKGEIS